MSSMILSGYDWHFTFQKDFTFWGQTFTALLKTILIFLLYSPHHYTPIFDNISIYSWSTFIYSAAARSFCPKEGTVQIHCMLLSVMCNPYISHPWYWLCVSTLLLHLSHRNQISQIESFLYVHLSFPLSIFLSLSYSLSFSLSLPFSLPPPRAVRALNVTCAPASSHCRPTWSATCSSTVASGPSSVTCASSPSSRSRPSRPTWSCICPSNPSSARHGFQLALTYCTCLLTHTHLMPNVWSCVKLTASLCKASVVWHAAPKKCNLTSRWRRPVIGPLTLFWLPVYFSSPL